MERINAKRLKKYLKNQGEGAVSDLAYKTRISVHTLMSMAGGRYHSQPSEKVKRILVEATGLPESELFIEIEDNKEDAS